MLDRAPFLLANDPTNPELTQIAEYLNRLEANVKAGDIATIAAVYESDAAAVDANFRRGDFSIESRAYERLAALRPALFGPSPIEGAPRLGNVLADFGILSLTGAIGGIAGVGAFGLLGNLGVRSSVALPVSSLIGNLTDQSLRNVAYAATNGYTGQSDINLLEAGFATVLPSLLYGGYKGIQKLEDAITGLSPVYTKSTDATSLSFGVLRSPNELAGVEPASEELLAAIGRKRDLIIARPGSEELRMLDYFGAEASVGGVNNSSILLRENPSKAAALEEFLHGTQARLGIVDRLGTSGLGSAETHVKDFLIRHQTILGLGDEDIRIIKILRDKGL